MSDNAWTKVAQAVIRLVAFALALTSFLLYLNDIQAALTDRPLSSAPVLVLKAIPFVLGMVLALRSRALAAHLTKDLD